MLSKTLDIDARVNLDETAIIDEYKIFPPSC
jgi:hypothetical protein